MLRLPSSCLLMAALAGAGSVAEAIDDPVVVLSTIADQSTIIPGDGVPFFTLSGFRCCGHYTAPAISAGNVVFWGAGAGGQPPAQQGIYVLRYGVLGKIADVNTPVPSGVGNFNQFAGDPMISGANVVFNGSNNSFQEGIYALRYGVLDRIVDVSMPVPSNAGNFTTFPDMGISGANVAFDGAFVVNNSVQGGVYAAGPMPVWPASPIKIADANTPVPNGIGNFIGWGGTAISGTTVAFTAAGSSDVGIYVSKAGGPLAVAVDSHTAIPGGSGNFDNFSGLVSFDGANLAFVGHGPLAPQGVHGVYTVTLPPDLVGIPQPVKVADTSTLVPGSSATFTRFGYVAIDHGQVVFEARSVQNGVEITGLYTNATGTLTKLVDTTDTIDGKQLQFLTFGTGGFSGNQAVFAAEFTDFSTAIVSATLTGNRCPLTHGYWKNHASVWPATTLILGNQSYSQEEALALLNMPTKGDASLVLARQLIAAKLNVLNFAAPQPVAAAIADADGVLAKFAGKLPYGIKGGVGAASVMTGNAGTLDNYNGGGLTPSCLCRRESGTGCS